MEDVVAVLVLDLQELKGLAGLLWMTGLGALRAAGVEEAPWPVGLAAHAEGRPTVGTADGARQAAGACAAALGPGVASVGGDLRGSPVAATGEVVRPLASHSNRDLEEPCLGVSLVI